MPGDVSLWAGLTGGECMDILAGVHGGVNPDRRATLIERFDLDPTKRARDYSKGNRQKVALIAGPEEFAQGAWKVKDLARREETAVPTADVAGEIRKILGAG